MPKEVPFHEMPITYIGAPIPQQIESENSEFPESYPAEPDQMITVANEIEGE